jgi:hypothetical protein
MTTKDFARGLTVMVALCVTATAGRAQSDRIFVLVGGSALNNKQSFTEGFINYSTSYAMGGRGIAGVELPLKGSKIFGLEVSYAYGQSNLKLANLNYTYQPITAYGLRDNRVSADIVAHAPGAYHGIHPYVAAGLEFDEFSPTSAAQTLATKIGFAFEGTAKLSSQGTGGVNFGGGLDHKFLSKVDLRIDIRDHLFSSPTFGLPSTQPSTAGLAWFPVKGRASDIVYSVGIVYHFGRGRSSAAPSEPAAQTASTEQTKSAKPRSSRKPSSTKMPSSPPSPM